MSTEFKDSFIQGNSLKINKKLDILTKNIDPILKAILEKTSYAVYADLKKATPVGDNSFDYFEQGELKESWYVTQISDDTFEIGNPKEYILYVEFGLNKLSSNPIKRMNSLAFLYAVGVFDSKTDEYKYTANSRVKKTGFIRLVLKKWDMKIKKQIIKMVGEQLKEFYKSL